MSTATRALWDRLFGDRRDYLAIFSAHRNPDTQKFSLEDTKYFLYPDQIDQAEACAQRQDELGRETYFCAHLLLERRRVKENASSILTLWAEKDDGDELPPSVPAPTARVRSSPGRQHLYWRLSRPIQAQLAESLNKRMATAIGADPSGFDLSQVLRVPDTRNYKYPDKPIVELVEIDNATTYNPDDLDRILPGLSEPKKATAPSGGRVAADPDDDRLIELGLKELGPSFRHLWEGVITDYVDLQHPRGNPSRADWGLVKDLLKLTGPDPERLERLARRSGLVRDKWAEKHAGDGRSYLRLTIDEAIIDGVPPMLSGSAAVNEATRIISDTKGGDLICRPKAEWDRLSAAEQRLKKIETIIANPGLEASTKLVSIGAILELERRGTWRPSALEQHTGTPDGYRIVSRARISRNVGMSDRAVSRHLKVAASVGVLSHRPVGLARGAVDPLTGEILTGPRQYMALRLPGDADAALEQLATASVATDWGGPGREKGVCSKHPFAGTVEKARRTLHCEACGEQLAQSVQVVLTDETKPLSTLPPVVLTRVQDVPTGPTTAAEKRTAAQQADMRLDREHAAELAAGLDLLYARGSRGPAPNGSNGQGGGHHPPRDPTYAELDWVSKMRRDEEARASAAHNDGGGG